MSSPKLTGPAVHTQWFDDTIPAESGYEPKIMYKPSGARVTVGSLEEQDAAWAEGFTFDAPPHPLSMEDRLTMLEMRLDEITEPDPDPEADGTRKHGSFKAAGEDRKHPKYRLKEDVKLRDRDKDRDKSGPVKGDTPILNTQTPDPNKVPRQELDLGQPKPIQQPMPEPGMNPRVADTPGAPPPESAPSVGSLGPDRK